MQRINGNAICRQLNKSAGNLFSAKFRGHEVDEPALLTKMRASLVVKVGAARRLLENVSRTPRGTRSMPITTALYEVELFFKQLQNSRATFVHKYFPRGTSPPKQVRVRSSLDQRGQHRTWPSLGKWGKSPMNVIVITVPFQRVNVWAGKRSALKSGVNHVLKRGSIAEDERRPLYLQKLLLLEV